MTLQKRRFFGIQWFSQHTCINRVEAFMMAAFDTPSTGRGHEHRQDYMNTDMFSSCAPFHIRASRWERVVWASFAPELLRAYRDCPSTACLTAPKTAYV